MTNISSPLSPSRKSTSPGFSVTVLALRDAGNPDAGFVPITPDYRFKAGDLLVAAGRPADIRRFARELEHRVAPGPAGSAQTPASTGKR